MPAEATQTAMKDNNHKAGTLPTAEMKKRMKKTVTSRGLARSVDDEASL
jgi:hypothetical protein